MKRLLFLLLFMSAGAAAFSQAADSIRTRSIVLRTSAVCEMCKETIEKAMAYEKGVKTFKLDVDSKMLTLTYDPRKTDPTKIRKAVTMVGYDADSLPADPRAYERLSGCCKK